MPRKARIDAAGALHHIAIRGIERKPIFKDGKDYRGFLDHMGHKFLYEKGGIDSRQKASCFVKTSQDKQGTSQIKG